MKKTTKMLLSSAILATTSLTSSIVLSDIGSYYYENAETAGKSNIYRFDIEGDILRVVVTPSGNVTAIYIAADGNPLVATVVEGPTKPKKDDISIKAESQVVYEDEYVRIIVITLDDGSQRVIVINKKMEK